jgi:hypothetical protein
MDVGRCCCTKAKLRNAYSGTLQICPSNVTQLLTRNLRKLGDLGSLPRFRFVVNTENNRDG